MTVTLRVFSELEETLMLLPFSIASEILQRLPVLLRKDYHSELIAKLALCLIQVHHGPIVSNVNLLSTLEKVKALAMEKISTLRVTKLYCIWTRTNLNKIIQGMDVEKVSRKLFCAFCLKTSPRH